MPNVSLHPHEEAVLDALVSPALAGQSVPSIQVGHAALLSHASTIVALKSLQRLGYVDADTSARWRITAKGEEVQRG